MKKIPFVTGEYYHLYNRGVEKRDLFINDLDRARFVHSLVIFNTRKLHSSSASKLSCLLPYKDPLIEIVSFCLMNNHYHVLAKQCVDGGTSKFFSRLGDGYTKYFNIKYNRSGRLFENTFKSTHIKTNGQLLVTANYIHRNPLKLPEIQGVFNQLEKYTWSSLPNYINDLNNPHIHTDVILDQFRNRSDYWQFLRAHPNP